MSLLHLIFCYFTIYNVSEGKLVQGIIGQNVSFSWTFSISREDAINILRNGTLIHRFFPNYNSFVQRESVGRLSFSIYYNTTKNAKVTINLSNVTENDAGTYRLAQQWDSRDLDDSVHLQTIVISDYTTMATNHTKETKETSYYTTAALNQKKLTEGINNYYTSDASQKEGINDCTTMRTTLKEDTEGMNLHKTTGMITKLEAEEFPSKRHLLYIVLGMGAILAVAFLACLRHKIKIWLREDTISNSNMFLDCHIDAGEANLQEETSPGNYWTIVSNERGVLSTAIEIDCGQTVAPIKDELMQFVRPDNIHVNEDIDGYLNPIHSSPVELNDYIHPIHSSPVTSGFVSTHQSTDF